MDVTDAELSSTIPCGRSSANDWVREAIHTATMAPSSHNSQPWKFVLRNNGIELRADRSRRLPVADPEGRELTISCGAALFHLRLAFLHAGYRPEVSLLPDPNDPDLLARVSLGGEAALTPDESMLFAAIPRRRTNRQAYAPGIVPDRLPITLEADAAAEGAWLQIAAEGIRDSIIRYVDEANRHLWADRRYRDELASWIHPAERGDGLVDQYRHGIGPLVVRAFDFGGSTAEHDAALAKAAPLLAVLGTNEDSPRNWLIAGQALARVLLRASAMGLDSAFFNQPIEVPEVRPRLARELGRKDAFPQMIIRMGDGPMIEPSPRRPTDEVLIN